MSIVYSEIGNGGRDFRFIVLTLLLTRFAFIHSTSSDIGLRCHGLREGGLHSFTFFGEETIGNTSKCGPHNWR